MNLNQSRPGHEELLMVSVRAWRNQGEAIILQLEQIIRQDALANLPVPELHPHPETSEFRTRIEQTAFRNRLFGIQISNKRNHFYIFVWNQRAGAVGPQKLDSRGAKVGPRADETYQRVPVEPADEDFFCCGSRQVSAFS